jgi:hypothetical protein
MVIPDTPLQIKLQELRACYAGREFVGSQTLRQAWADPLIPDQYRMWLLDILHLIPPCSCKGGFIDPDCPYRRMDQIIHELPVERLYEAMGLNPETD